MEFVAYIKARELVETSLGTSSLTRFKRAWSLPISNIPCRAKGFFHERTAATKGTTAKIKARENRIVIRVVRGRL
jgi:hypothetical protein